MRKKFDVKAKRVEAEKLADGKLKTLNELEQKKAEAVSNNNDILEKLAYMPEAMNIDEFSKLKYNADLTKATISFYESKIEAIKKRGLVDQADSDNLLQDVRAEQEAILNEAYSTILPMIETLMLTITEYTNRVDECTDLLVFWGNNVGNYSKVKMNAWFSLEPDDFGLKSLVQTLKHSKCYKLLKENE